MPHFRNIFVCISGPGRGGIQANHQGCAELYQDLYSDLYKDYIGLCSCYIQGYFQDYIEFIMYSCSPSRSQTYVATLLRLQLGLCWSTSWTTDDQLFWLVEGLHLKLHSGLLFISTSEIIYGMSGAILQANLLHIKTLYWSMFRVFLGLHLEHISLTLTVTSKKNVCATYWVW